MVVSHQDACVQSGAFQEHMIEKIRARFGGLLGADAALLDTPEGLDALAHKTLARLRGTYAGVWETFPALGE